MDFKKTDNLNYDMPLGFTRQTSEQKWALEVQRRKNQKQQQVFKSEFEEINQEESHSNMFEALNGKKEWSNENPYSNMLKNIRATPALRFEMKLSRFDSNLQSEPKLDKRESMDHFQSICERKKSESVPFERKSEKGFVPIDSFDNKPLFSEQHDQLSLGRFNSKRSQLSLNLGNEKSICHPHEIKPQENDVFLVHNIDYPNFHQLYELLKKHFLNDRIDQSDLKLREHEYSILQTILNRKYKHKIDFVKQRCFLFDKLNDPNALISRKRPEENYKFIFKRCIKFMRERLKAFATKKLPKKDFDEFFYNHYFSDTAKRLDLPLDNFKNPKNSKSNKSQPKTINMRYISNIKQSVNFMTDFDNYIDSHLKDDYKITIESKLEKMVKKWESDYQSVDRKDDVVKDIIAYVEKNKKCKLPWTLKEITRAIQSLKKMFEECEKFLEK